MTFKDALQHLTVFVGGLLIIYLILTIGTLEPNPADWGEAARFICEALFGGWIVLYVDAVKE